MKVLRENYLIINAIEFQQVVALHVAAVCNATTMLKYCLKHANDNNKKENEKK